MNYPGPEDWLEAFAARHFDHVCIGCGREPYPEGHPADERPWMCDGCRRALGNGATMALDALGARLGLSTPERDAIGTLLGSLVRRLRR